MLCVELLISNKCDPLVRVLGCLAAGRILLVFYEGGSGLQSNLHPSKASLAPIGSCHAWHLLCFLDCTS